MCCGGPNSDCPTLAKSQCKCRCAKCRHCSSCGRETIGKAAGLFGAVAVGVAVNKFKKKRTFSVTSDSGVSDSSGSPPSSPSDESCVGSLCNIHTPTRYSRPRGKLTRSFSVQQSSFAEEGGDEADDVTESKSPSRLRLQSLQIPTRYSRSDSVTESPSKRSSMARNASDDCCIQ